jgi:hypothetical protein
VSTPQQHARNVLYKTSIVSGFHPHGLAKKTGTVRRGEWGLGSDRSGPGKSDVEFILNEF